MRPVDRAARTYLTGKTVGQTTAACRECGSRIHPGDQLSVYASRKRGINSDWTLHLMCRDCAVSEIRSPFAGVDEFIATAAAAAGDVGATSTRVPVVLADVEVVTRSLAGDYGAQRRTATDPSVME